ncbi:hypothetical protein BKA93DRAFT_720624, partial [Sparassis latifolia]
MQVSKPRRHRTASDPFSDPTSHSYSAYGIPTLSRNAPAQQVTNRPPPVPSKVTTRPAPTKRSYPSPAMNRENVAEAVRDTVQLRSNDQNPRTKIGRSQTELPPPSGSRPPTAPVSRRSLSQDSVLRAANTVEKSKTNTRARAGKKGSSHADVIDRLDFSGVGPMFHHDGPFDACAPSRNRHRTRAPMLAWSGVHDADKEALANAHDVAPGLGYDSPYPSAAVYVPYQAPKKKHDAIAEAWGTHEPEPFEDFSAGGGATTRGISELRGASSPRGVATANSNLRRTKDGRAARDVYREYLDDGQVPSNRRQQTKRSIPPPQPIFVADNESGDSGSPPSPSAGPPSPGTPKRTRSIMRRIRKMRDSPNVPVGPDDVPPNEHEISPTSSMEDSAVTHPAYNARPTHRSQNS